MGLSVATDKTRGGTGAAGSLEQAIGELRRRLGNSPSDATVHRAIGDLYLKHHSTAEAIEAYLQAAGIFVREDFVLEAIAVYEKTLKLDPERVDIYTLLGDLNADRGFMYNAVADYLSGAKLYLKIGKTRESLALYRKVAQVNPANATAHLRVAELCLKERLVDEAVDEYLYVAEEYERLHRSDDARRLYEQVLKVAPTHSEARRRLGLEPALPSTPAVEATASDKGQAKVPGVGEMAGTIEFNPEWLELEPAAAPALLPSPGAGAPASLEEAVELLSEEALETHYDLGLAYKDLGLLNEAIEEFQVAARRPTRFLDACVMIAACYKECKLHQPAIACLERALADSRCENSVAPYVQYDLAVLYEEDGFADKAAQLYASIPTIRDAEERLISLQCGATRPA